MKTIWQMGICYKSISKELWLELCFVLQMLDSVVFVVFHVYSTRSGLTLSTNGTATIEVDAPTADLHAANKVGAIM